jgi:hypothetical protein
LEPCGLVQKGKDMTRYHRLTLRMVTIYGRLPWHIRWALTLTKSANKPALWTWWQHYHYRYRKHYP